MKKYEIGGSFLISDNILSSSLNNFSDILLSSGRDAIRLIIKNNPKLKKVYLPIFLCDSIITPFLEAKIEIHFYKVNTDFSLHLDNKISDSFVLFINYFGLNNQYQNLIFNLQKSRNIVIEDLTQSLFNFPRFNLVSQANYYFASLRKWFGLFSGALVGPAQSLLIDSKYSKFSEESIALKKLADSKKQLYIFGYGEKDYLTIYKDFEELFDKSKEIHLIDDFSRSILEKIDINKIIQIRQQNFLTLNKKFRLYNSSNQKATFYPFLTKTREQRNYLRDFLIKSSIFCPVHWRIPKNLPDSFNLDVYDRYLSIPIDHRYNDKDMNFIIDKVNLSRFLTIN
jgi:hypothetical protein